MPGKKKRLGVEEQVSLQYFIERLRYARGLSPLYDGKSALHKLGPSLGYGVSDFQPSKGAAFTITEDQRSMPNDPSERLHLGMGLALSRMNGWGWKWSK